MQKACFRDYCVDAEIADSLDKRASGLMFREDIPEDRAMLFIFQQEQIPKFWMKNVRFPLDILWINKDKIIVGIERDVPLCQDSCPPIVPNQKVSYVLEAKAGFVSRHQVKIGEKISFQP